MKLQDTMARGQVYAMLSAAWLEAPHPGLIAAVADHNVLDWFGAALGADAVACLRSLPEQALDQATLARLFDELFRVPGGRFVSPFESTWFDIYQDDRGRERRRLMGPSARNVALFFDAAGCELNDLQACGAMPDHIAAELDFMHHLCERALAAADAGDSEQVRELEVLQARFVREHLNVWLGSFATATAEAAPDSFYDGVARLTAAFVAWDAAHGVACIDPGARLTQSTAGTGRRSGQARAPVRPTG